MHSTADPTQRDVASSGWLSAVRSLCSSSLIWQVPGCRRKLGCILLRLGQVRWVQRGTLVPALACALGTRSACCACCAACSERPSVAVLHMRPVPLSALQLLARRVLWRAASTQSHGPGHGKPMVSALELAGVPTVHHPEYSAPQLPPGHRFPMVSSGPETCARAPDCDPELTE